ncbi:MAG: chromosome segregation protein SMC [Anaerolineales bacterium]|nr:chromosome segregation protein SMC [Anaerolineales bacterium]
MSFTDGAASRLKSLDLQGYKTFALKTEIALAPTITVVVGPNGTGKSNIADAIRWVLGEQSYSLLRGKRTEDMIFSGSENRPRASMAMATITFDNSDGWLPIEFSEVSISRRAYRDGQNEYLINGQRVRLRDVTELLANCGLGQRTYTIIGQGLVDAALSLKADERRRLFEEAAGIGLYRSRREEALRRLDHTRRNLERVQDILAELQPRLRSLKRQAKRAGEYEQVQSDLDAALRVWYGYHWYHLMEVVSTAKADSEEKRKARDGLRQEQMSAERELATTRTHIDTLRSQLQTWSQQVSMLHTDREVMGRNLAVARERLRWLADQETLIQSELSSLERTRESLEQDLSQARESEQGKRETLELAQIELRDLGQTERAEPEHLQAHLDRVEELRKALEVVAAEQAAWQARYSLIEERVESLELQRVSLTSDQEVSESAVSEAQAGVTELEIEHRRAKQDHEQAVEKYTAAQNDLAEIEAERIRVQDRLSDLQSQDARLAALLQVRRVALEAHEEFLNQIRGGASEGQIEGFAGIISDQLKISAKYQMAINAALGEFQRSLVFGTIEELLAALVWLETKSSDGHAALLALDANHRPPRIQVPSDPGCLADAASLVQADERFQAAIDVLLGQTLVVTDIGVAQRILPDLPAYARVVTLKGDLFYPSGQVLLGKGSSDERDRQSISQIEADKLAVSEALADIRRQLEQHSMELKITREKLEISQQAVDRAREVEHQAALAYEQAGLTLKDAQDKLTKTRHQVQALDKAWMEIQQERELLEDQRPTFEQDRLHLERQLKEAVDAVGGADPHLGLARVEGRLEVARLGLDDAQSRASELSKRLLEVQAQLDEWTNRLQTTKAEQGTVGQQEDEAEKGMDELEGQLSALKGQTRPAEESLLATERRRNELEAEENRWRVSLQNTERQHSHAQIELARRQEELVSLRRRIEDDFGLVAFDYGSDVTGQDPLPFEGLVERLPRVENLPLELGSQVNHLRAQMRRMGAVNPEAQREYEEVDQRVVFLTSQVGDLRKAEKQIQEVIAELDLLMEREFRKTFDEVAAAFRDAFKRLFGGGNARLLLTDPSDLTQTGIDIEARLPGRRSQGLAVLSGGERSLVATALIFALLKVSPTPFCVLDEVDAMLDEANVIRFCEMLQELSQDTQFMVITHNRLTVQAAEVIYGVSMGADSVSRVISLKLDEAEKELVA